MLSLNSILVISSFLLLLSIFASKVSARLGVPSLLIFLLIGMLAGSDGPGGIHFDDPQLAQSLGTIALAFILFSGGLDTQWNQVKRVFWKGLSLSSLGVMISAFVMGFCAHFFFDFSWIEGLLLGAIVSSTDAAAVFTILRSKKISLKGELRPLLEFESGSNDPMAVVLTLALINLLTRPYLSILDLFQFLLFQMIFGLSMGFIMGKGTVSLLNRLKLEYEGLYPVLTISLVLLTYGLTDLIGGNGFLSVYLAGLLVGKESFPYKNSLTRFHDGLAWLTQIAMFLILGLLVFPSQLPPVAGIGFAISLLLILVARPLSVFCSLAFTKMSANEKLMVSWVGLRGAVPIILATFPLVAGIPQASTLFNLVFFIVITSSLFQGTTLSWIASWLKVKAPLERKRRYPIELEKMEGLEAKLVDFIVPYSSKVVGKPIAALQLPEGCLITLICRAEDFIVPGGQTTLEGGDVVLVLVHDHYLPEVNLILTGVSPEQLKT